MGENQEEMQHPQGSLKVQVSSLSSGQTTVHSGPNQSLQIRRHQALDACETLSSSQLLPIFRLPHLRVGNSANNLGKGEL